MSATIMTTEVVLHQLPRSWWPYLKDDGLFHCPKCPRTFLAAQGIGAHWSAHHLVERRDAGGVLT